MMRVYPSPDELQAALDRLGNPGTRDESLVFVAAQAGIAALRGLPVVWAETEADLRTTRDAAREVAEGRES